jgi:hypothetical protein
MFLIVYRTASVTTIDSTTRYAGIAMSLLRDHVLRLLRDGDSTHPVSLARYVYIQKFMTASITESDAKI